MLHRSTGESGEQRDGAWQLIRKKGSVLRQNVEESGNGVFYCIVRIVLAPTHATCLREKDSP